MGKPIKSIDEYIEIIEKCMSVNLAQRVTVSFWRVDRLLKIEGEFSKKDREASSIFIEDDDKRYWEVPIGNIYHIEKIN